MNYCVKCKLEVKTTVAPYMHEGTSYCGMHLVLKLGGYKEPDTGKEQEPTVRWVDGDD